jgi:hypothetical protein
VAVAVLWPAVVMEAAKGWGREAAVGRSHPISAPPRARRQGEIPRNR